MKHYLCYYCECETDTFQAIIDHMISYHLTDCLKYRELELNEASGSVVYRTKAHVDFILTDGDIVISADNKVGIYSYDRSKKKKLNTPCKFPDKTPTASSLKSTVNINPEYESIETLLNQMEIGTSLPVDDEIISYEDNLHELINLMPAVTEKLKEYGCLRGSVNNFVNFLYKTPISKRLS